MRQQQLSKERLIEKLLSQGYELTIQAIVSPSPKLSGKKKPKRILLHIILTDNPDQVPSTVVHRFEGIYYLSPSVGQQLVSAIETHGKLNFLAKRGDRNIMHSVPAIAP